MTILIATIPVMLLVIAAVIAPLVFAMKHEHKLHTDELLELEAKAAVREDARVAA